MKVSRAHHVMTSPFKYTKQGIQAVVTAIVCSIKLVYAGQGHDRSHNVHDVDAAMQHTMDVAPSMITLPCKPPHCRGSCTLTASCSLQAPQHHHGTSLRSYHTSQWAWDGKSI